MAADGSCFLASGLWHGASWTSVAWGALHGAYLVGSRLTESIRAQIVTAIGLGRRPALQHAVRVVTTFHMVVLG